MTLMIVIIGIIALVFVYAAIKGMDPRDVFKRALVK